MCTENIIIIEAENQKKLFLFLCEGHVMIACAKLDCQIKYFFI